MVVSKPKPAVNVTERPKVRSHRSRALLRFWHNKAGVAGAIIVAFMLLFAFGLTLFIPFPSTNVLLANKMPFEAPGHPLGTDIAGRDMVALLAYGTRTSLIIAIAVQFLVVGIAVVLGFSAGWFGGRIDFAVNRTTAVDSMPRHFGLMPARFSYRIDYLIRKRWYQRLFDAIRTRISPQETK